MRDFFGHLGDEKNGGEVLKDGWHLLPPAAGREIRCREGTLWEWEQRGGELKLPLFFALEGGNLVTGF